MKVTVRQLRGIIKEVIAGPEESATSLDLAIQKWTEDWAAKQMSVYDEADPLMAGIGLDEWQRQVEAAQTELRGAISQAAEQELEAVEGKLYAGDY